MSEELEIETLDADELSEIERQINERLMSNLAATGDMDFDLVHTHAAIQEAIAIL